LPQAFFPLAPLEDSRHIHIMSTGRGSSEGDHAHGAQFTTTHWSVILEAGQYDSPKASEALEQLCRTYWYPLYAYVRRKGYEVPEAEDLTQEFFAKLLSKRYLTVADRNRGKFRSFLLGSLEHFLAREWTRAHSQKRGGSQPLLSWDELEAENRYRLEPAQELSAEKIFDRRWATTVLEQAMTLLREECATEGKADLFERVQGCLSGEKGEASYSQIATSLNMSEGALKVAVHRLRRRYGELVRAQITQTVTTPQEQEEELQHLFAVLRS
jgi:DNA-directed RNA polymerase specialized sigma24 family protein